MIEFKRVTDISHIDEIFAVYSAAILTMEQDGIFQWDEFYPDKQTIAEDIVKNQMFIGLEGDKIAVCFVLNSECDNLVVGYANWRKGKFELKEKRL